MIVVTHREFEKQIKKLKPRERVKLKQRLLLFLENSSDPVLNNHALKGEYHGYRSINITGDLRAIYKPVNKSTALFIKIDTHSNLYS